MKPIGRFTSTTIVLPGDDIDTDRIIPARFLTVTTREGLGRWLFADVPAFDHPIGSAGVLVCGDNFGCGSSREHAVWALRDFGFGAVIAKGFADIFRANALGNGLLPIEVDDEVHATLVRAPGEGVTIDLEACTIEPPGGLPVTFEMDPFARYRLLRGIDELGVLLTQADAIAEFERNRGS